jgi:PTS system mannose-specific IIA component
MIGIVIAAHGRLAEELLLTARQIVGELPAVATCSVQPGASPEEIRTALDAAIHTVDTGDGVMVLADLYGGSPCTQSLMLCARQNLEVLTGVNLPMVLKANSLRMTEKSLPVLARTLAQHAQANITLASLLLRHPAA